MSSDIKDIQKKIDNGEKLNEEELEVYWDKAPALEVDQEDWKWLEKYLAEDLRLEDDEHDSDNSCRKECQRQDGDE